MLTRRGWAAIVAGIGAYLVAWAFGADVLVPLAALLIAGPLLALVFVRRRGDGRLRLTVGVAPTRPLEGAAFRVEARVRGRASAGGSVRLVIGGQSLVAPLERGSDDDGIVRLAASGLPRGVHSIDGGELATVDPFGFARDGRTLQGTSRVVVWPRWQELGDALGGRHGEGEVAQVRRRPRAIGYDLHGIREHQEGESLRRVDWKTSARTGRLMVREMEEAAGAELAIIVDLDRTLLDPDRLDRMARSAATAARGATLGGRRATLVLVGATVQRIPLDGAAAWHSAMDALAAARADRSPPLSVSLERDPGLVRADAITLITASADPALAALLDRVAAYASLEIIHIGAIEAGVAAPPRSVPAAHGASA